MNLILFEHLTRNGRVELANYQTRKLPSDMAISLFVKHAFVDFYRALFDRQVSKAAISYGIPRRATGLPVQQQSSISPTCQTGLKVKRPTSQC
jgi:hypothetical protein